MCDKEDFMDHLSEVVSVWTKAAHGDNSVKKQTTSLADFTTNYRSNASVFARALAPRPDMLDPPFPREQGLFGGNWVARYPSHGRQAAGGCLESAAEVAAAAAAAGDRCFPFGPPPQRSDAALPGPADGTDHFFSQALRGCDAPAAPGRAPMPQRAAVPHRLQMPLAPIPFRPAPLIAPQPGGPVAQAPAPSLRRGPSAFTTVSGPPLARLLN